MVLCPRNVSAGNLATTQGVTSILPIDLKIHERDDFTTVRERRFERGDPYYQSVAEGWAEALGMALAELPDFHF